MAAQQVRPFACSAPCHCLPAGSPYEAALPKHKQPFLLQGVALVVCALFCTLTCSLVWCVLGYVRAAIQVLTGVCLSAQISTGADPRFAASPTACGVAQRATRQAASLLR